MKINPETRAIMLTNLKQVVANYYNMPLQAFEINKNSRKEEDIKPRRIVTYLARTLFRDRLAFKDIAISLGGFKHVTAFNLFKTVSALIETEKQYRSDVNKIISKIISGPGVDAAMLRDRVQEEHLFLSLDTVTVVRGNNGTAVLFCGEVNEKMTQLIQSLLPGASAPKQVCNTGLALLYNKT